VQNRMNPSKSRVCEQTRTGSDTPELMDMSHAASHLGTTERHLRRLWQERRISAVKVGRSVRFSIADLEAYIERNRRSALR
jgi:excisionase family DNA binding protein